MLFTIRRRSQDTFFLARAEGSCTLDRHVQREVEGVVHLLFSEAQVDRRPARCHAEGNPRG